MDHGATPPASARHRPRPRDGLELLRRARRRRLRPVDRAAAAAHLLGRAARRAGCRRGRVDPGGRGRPLRGPGLLPGAGGRRQLPRRPQQRRRRRRHRRGGPGPARARAQRRRRGRAGGRPAARRHPGGRSAPTATCARTPSTATAPSRTSASGPGSWPGGRRASWDWGPSAGPWPGACAGLGMHVVSSDPYAPDATHTPRRAAGRQRRGVAARAGHTRDGGHDRRRSNSRRCAEAWSSSTRRGPSSTTPTPWSSALAVRAGGRGGPRPLRGRAPRSRPPPHHLPERRAHAAHRRGAPTTPRRTTPGSSPKTCAGSSPGPRRCTS